MSTVGIVIARRAFAHEAARKVVTPRPEPDGSAALHRGWLVGVVQAGRSRLRFTTDQRHFMCWCNESWRSLVPKL